MSRHIIELYGIDVVLAREPSLAPRLFPGATSRLARFHLPPEEAGLGDSGRQSSGRDKDGSGKGLGEALGDVDGSCEGVGEAPEGRQQLHVSQVNVMGGLDGSEPIEPRGQHHPQLLGAAGVGHEASSAPPVEPRGDHPACGVPPAVRLPAETVEREEGDEEEIEEIEEIEEEIEEEIVKQLRQALDARGVVLSSSSSAPGALPRHGESERKMLARVLRGKPHPNSLPHAVDRIASYAEWCVDNGADSWPMRGEEAVERQGREILGCDPATIQTFLPHRGAGVDRLGRPVMYKHLGRQFMVKGMVKHASLERLVNYNCYFQERNVVRDESGALRQWVSVVDVAGMHFGMFSSDARKLLYRISKRDEIFYTDVLAMVIIVNAPPSFAFVWRIAQTWMEASMRERTHIISERTPEVATQRLTRLIDPSQLPANYGGDAPAFA
eukprot:2657256-Prymnesium_polylepis.1